MANLLEDIQCAGSDTRPPMLDRNDFTSWQQGLSFRIFRVDRIVHMGTMHRVQVQQVMGELIIELEYFKDKMLLMQAQENGVALDKEQLLFIVGGQDNVVDEDVDEQTTMFEANLSSSDPAYDEAGLSYDSDILSEVHDHDHYQDAICEHHEVHEMHDDVQPNYIVDSHANYTSDSNMILYDQYVEDDSVLVIQSNVSSVPNDAYMMILNDMHEQPAQHVSITTHNNVVDKTLTAELATYKEQVKLNNREVHLDYLKHLKTSRRWICNQQHKESVETLHEIVEEAKVERPLDRSLVSVCLYTKHSQELLEYVISTCLKDINKRDTKQATIPLTRKKQVTFVDQCETSNNNTHKHVEHQTTQKTYVPTIPSIGVNSYTNASGSNPSSNTKKNRISSATSVNKKTVEDHPRTNKSNLEKPNRADSSISSKRTVINSNSDSVCQTCNKCFILANYDMCVIKYLNFMNEFSYVKNIVRKDKQVWKPKPVNQVWKATGKVRTNVGYQWKPTKRIFTLGEQCPLTRFTQTKVVPAKQPENVNISKIVVTKNLSHTSHKPLTRYQRRNKLNKVVPAGIPSLTDTSMQPVVSANQLDSNNNWGSNCPNYPSLFVFKCRSYRSSFGI
uniref:Integrase, catalytic region, zinc finger, CCHC-type, peptidase aspartic, catalytic n=1 Tax=Tanacetum cinerariifolium TaxID=118510 RepID=A0A6L2NZP8_TANCI|nr:hypothetical protein [Tanacetum cinerariifolium]